VWSLDLTPHASTAAGPCRPVQADALQTPFRAGSIDFVFCASLIEHVPFPGDLMREIRRVLRTGGVCYLSFPPFFAPQGGHEFAPFHYLGERAALWLRKRAAPPPPWVREMYAPTENPRSFAEAYRGWGLYRMTISRARGLIRESGLAVTDMRPRYVWFNTAALPILGEFLTWHVQFLLVKREPASP
jgi:SAM-dependent methyltransferase